MEKIGRHIGSGNTITKTEKQNNYRNLVRFKLFLKTYIKSWECYNLANTLRKLIILVAKSFMICVKVNGGRVVLVSSSM